MYEAASLQASIAKALNTDDTLQRSPVGKGGIYAHSQEGWSRKEVGGIRDNEKDATKGTPNNGPAYFLTSKITIMYF